MPDVSEFITLMLLGFGVGAYGTMIGAGGGFLLVPALLFLYPGHSPSEVTAMALTAVFFNAYGGSWAYARAGRIDYGAGLLFAVAGVPGALLGTLLVEAIPRKPFEWTFGFLLIGIGIYLALNPAKRDEAEGPVASWETTPWSQRRTLAGTLGSAYLGVLSSLLGIGGGILHVPFLIRVLNFRPHTATATSHFVLAIVTFSAALAHLFSGSLTAMLAPTAFVALGVMMGAPLGAVLSNYLRGPALIRFLAAALACVGLRMIWRLVT